MLLTFFTSLESIVPIIIMILVGYFMSRARWIDDKFGNAITKYLLNIALPCYMIWNLVSNFDRNKFFSLIGGISVPLLSMGATYILSIFISNLIKVPRSHKGIFRSIFFCSNTIFVGLPINLELFGQESVPYVLIYYIVNTTYFWTIGNYEISCDGNSANNVSFFSKATVKKILTPALLGFMVGILLIIIKIKLPGFMMDTLDYLGAPTTPFALIFIGLVLSSVQFSELKFDRELLILLGARFILSPALVFLLLHFIHVPPLMEKVFIIQSVMPAMTNTSIVAKDYGADCKYASVATVITTLACIIVIPILMILI
jgi:predicted permease